MRNVLPNSSASEDMEALQWAKANLPRDKYVAQLQLTLDKYGTEAVFYDAFKAERSGTAPQRAPAPANDAQIGGSIADTFAYQADVGQPPYEPSLPSPSARRPEPSQVVAAPTAQRPPVSVTDAVMPEVAGRVPAPTAARPVPVDPAGRVPPVYRATPPADVARAIIPEFAQQVTPEVARTAALPEVAPAAPARVAVAAAAPSPRPQSSEIPTQGEAPKDDAPWLEYKTTAAEGQDTAAGGQGGDDAAPWLAYQGPAERPGLSERAAIHAREGLFDDGGSTGQAAASIMKGDGARGVADAGYEALDKRNYGGDFPSDFEVQRRPTPVSPARRMQFAGMTDEEILAQSAEKTAVADQKTAEFNAMRGEQRAEYKAMPDSEGFLEKSAVVAGRLAGNAPSAENLIPTGRAATALRTFGQGAAVNAGVNALVEPGAQRTQIEAGDRKEFSFEDGLINVLIGGAVGGGLNVAPDAWRALRGVFAKKQGVAPEDVVPPANIDEIAEAAAADPEIARVLEASGLTKDSPKFAEAVERISQRRAQESARIEGGSQPLTTQGDIKAQEAQAKIDAKAQRRNIKNAPDELTAEQIAEARANGEMPPAQRPPEAIEVGSDVRAGNGAAPETTARAAGVEDPGTDAGVAQARGDNIGKDAGEDAISLVETQLGIPPETYARMPAAARKRVYDAAVEQRDATRPGDTLSTTDAALSNGEAPYSPATRPQEGAGAAGRGTKPTDAEIDARETAGQGTGYTRTAQGTADRPTNLGEDSSGLNFRDRDPETGNPTDPRAAKFEDDANTRAADARAATEEDLIRRWKEREQARPGKEDPAAGAKAQYGGNRAKGTFSNKAAEPDGDSRFGTDDYGFVKSSKGGPIKFKDQKQAAKWVINQGHKRSPDQIFEIENHPSGDGFTVRERGRSDPPGGSAKGDAPNEGAPRQEGRADTGGDVPRLDAPGSRESGSAGAREADADAAGQAPRQERADGSGEGSSGARTSDDPEPTGRDEPGSGNSGRPDGGTERTTLEDVAPKAEGGKRQTHVYAEYKGGRYYVGSADDQRGVDALVKRTREDVPDAAVFTTDRADGTSINGRDADLRDKAGVDRRHADQTPEQRAKNTASYHDKNFEAVRKDEPDLTRAEYDQRVKDGMSSFENGAADAAMGGDAPKPKPKRKGTTLNSGINPEQIWDMIGKPLINLLKREIKEASDEAVTIRRLLKASTSLSRPFAALANVAGLLVNSNRGQMFMIRDRYLRAGNAKVAEILGKLTDNLATDPGSGKKVGQVYEEAVNQKTFNIMNRMGNIVGKKNMGDPKFASDVGDVLAGRPNRASQEVRDVANRLRKILDELHTYAKDAGVDLGYTKDYFPRMLEAALVNKNPAGFEAAAIKVYKLMGLSDKDAKLAAIDWRERELGVGSQKFATQGPISDFTKGRKLPPEADTIMAEFYNRDAFETISNYARNVTRKAEFTRRFGENGVEIDKAMDDLFRNGADAADVDFFRYAMTSSLGLMNAGGMSRLGSATAWMQTVGIVRMLPRAVWSSVAEPFAYGVRTGNAMDGLKAFTNTIGEVFGSKRLDDQRDVAEFMGIIGDAMTHMVLNGQFGGGQASRLNNALLAKFFTRSGLQPLTEAQRLSGVRIGQDFVARLVRDAMAPDSARHKSSKGLLAELGIDGDDIGKMAKFLGSTKEGGAPKVADLMGDSAEARQYSAAIQRFVDESIQNPKAVDRPALANHPVGRLAYGIMSFMYAYTRNVTYRLGKQAVRGVTEKGLSAQDRLAMTAGPGLALAVLGSMQMGMAALRDRLTNKDESEERPAALTTVQYLSRAGALGNLDPLVNGVLGAKYERDLTALIAGPYVGQYLQDIQKGVGLIPAPIGKNSPNTNSAEWNASRAAYNAVAVPAIATALAMAPGGPLMRIGYGAMIASPLGPIGGVSATAPLSPQASSDFASFLAGERPDRWGGKGETTGRSSGGRSSGRSSGGRSSGRD